MKAAVFYAVILSVIATTSSQPTYDAEQQQSCDDRCRLHDGKLENLQNQIAMIKNEILQLLQFKEQMENLLFSGNTGTVNETKLPSGFPRPASE